MQYIKAIETKYKGHNFRSRLEARWAVFFENANIVWEYEKEGFVLSNGDQYLPDFWIPIQPQDEHPGYGYFVEIKVVVTPDSLKKAEVLASDSGHVVYLINGEPGTYRLWKWYRDGSLTYENVYVDLDCPFFENHMFTTANKYDDCCEHGDIWSAIEIARLARFEYGESG
jgi:hypothetical protein